MNLSRSHGTVVLAFGALPTDRELRRIHPRKIPVTAQVLLIMADYVLVPWKTAATADGRGKIPRKASILRVLGFETFKPHASAGRHRVTSRDSRDISPCSRHASSE